MKINWIDILITIVLTGIIQSLMIMNFNNVGGVDYLLFILPLFLFPLIFTFIAYTIPKTKKNKLISIWIIAGLFILITVLFWVSFLGAVDEEGVSPEAGFAGALLLIVGSISAASTVIGAIILTIILFIKTHQNGTHT